MKRYEESRAWNAAEVTVDHNPLRLRLVSRNHSPSEFGWGNGESGPAQLALALLADCLGNEERAVALHQEFKRMVVANLAGHGWTMTSNELQTRVRKPAAIERRI